jgi:hypothetical protein
MLLMVATLFISCEKVINIDLNEAEPRLVVEGAITLNNGPYAVKLSTSGDFYTGEGIEPVGDAVVNISASDGQQETLMNIGNGIYITHNLAGIPNTAYTLEIKYKNLLYTATDTLPGQVEIKDLTYEDSEFGGNQDTEYENHYDFYCKFKDPPEPGNHYLLQIKRNGEEISGRQGKYYMLSDENVNGQMVNYPLFGIGANINDTITIELSAVGAATYDYFRTLNDALGQGGMGSTPYNPVTNLNNNALGYFGTFTYDSGNIVIEEK